MSKQSKKSDNAKKEKLESELIKKQGQIDELMKELEARKRADEKRLEEEEEMAKARNIGMMVTADKDVYAEVSNNLSDVSERSGGSQIAQLPLNKARNLHLALYVKETLFAEVKFLDEESFKASPKIMEDAMKEMKIEDDMEKLQHSVATKKKIRYELSHKRSYVKGEVYKKYKGNVRIRKQQSCEHNIMSNTKHEFEFLQKSISSVVQQRNRW